MGNKEQHDEPHNATVEVVAFPYAQFQACVITGKAEVEWPPYTLDLYSLVPSPTS